MWILWNSDRGPVGDAVHRTYKAIGPFETGEQAHDYAIKHRIKGCCTPIEVLPPKGAKTYPRGYAALGALIAIPSGMEQPIRRRRNHQKRVS